MVQQRWRSGNNRLDPRQPVHDHRGGGGAKRRAGSAISTEWAGHNFADRHPHQPDADPCATPGFPERPNPEPHCAAAPAAPADDDRPAGDDAGSHLHADLHSDLHPDPYAALSGADPRAELRGTDREPVRPRHWGAHRVGAVKGTDAGAPRQGDAHCCTGDPLLSQAGQRCDLRGVANRRGAWA
jgi:hypothetical protein